MKGLNILKLQYRLTDGKLALLEKTQTSYYNSRKTYFIKIHLN